MSDVRQVTSQVALFMQSSAAANKSGNGGANAPAPAVLSFEWGAYQFQGFMESFKETIDFFSADGIPLRALVSIGLARQDNVFDTGFCKHARLQRQPGADVQIRAASRSAAAQGGDPNATRALASANGVENPRFTGGAALAGGRRNPVERRRGLCGERLGGRWNRDIRRPGRESFGRRGGWGIRWRRRRHARYGAAFRRAVRQERIASASVFSRGGRVRGSA